MMKKVEFYNNDGKKLFDAEVKDFDQEKFWKSKIYNIVSDGTTISLNPSAFAFIRIERGKI